MPGLGHVGRWPLVLVVGVRADNNQAEHRMRPLVIIRKISGGSRSDAGTSTSMGLASLFGTWVARGRNAFHECMQRLTDPSPAPA